MTNWQISHSLVVIFHYVSKRSQSLLCSRNAIPTLIIQQTIGIYQTSAQYQRRSLCVGVSKSDKDTTVLSLHSALSTLHFRFSQNGLVINPYTASESQMLQRTAPLRISPYHSSASVSSVCPAPGRLSEPEMRLATRSRASKTISGLLSTEQIIANVCVLFSFPWSAYIA